MWSRDLLLSPTVSGQFLPLSLTWLEQAKLSPNMPVTMSIFWPQGIPRVPIFVPDGGEALLVLVQGLSTGEKEACF